MTWEPGARSTGIETMIAGFHRAVLLQCRTSQVTRSAGAASRAGCGLVVTAERGNLRACLARARHLLEVDHYRGPVLLDAARYAGEARLTASAPFDRRWIESQRQLGLPVLTDSGYLAPGDAAGLVSVLERAARLGDAIALLAVHPHWLVDRYGRQTLVRYVSAVGVPVAVVLEAQPDDPVDGAAAITGLLHLIDCDVPVLLLRTGLSALGAVCSGAAAGAVGIEPALRRIPPTGAWCRPVAAPARRLSVLVRQCLSYQPLVDVAEGMRRHPDNGMWTCACPTCGGRDLGWIVAAPDADRDEWAFRHSVDVLLDLRDELTGPAVRLNQWSWRARCAAAASRRREVGWDRLPMLDHWQRAIPAPTSTMVTIPAPRRAGHTRRLPSVHPG